MKDLNTTMKENSEGFTIETWSLSNKEHIHVTIRGQDTTSPTEVFINGQLLHDYISDLIETSTSTNQ